MTRPGDNLRTTCVVLVAAATLGMLGACGGEDAVADMRPAAATTTAPPPTEAPAPPPTEAPAPAPTDAPVATAAPAPDEGDDDGDSSNVLTIVLIIAGAALALFVIAAVASGSKSKSKTSTRSGRPPASSASRPPSPQTSLLSTSQWINDQLSLELMAASPEAAAQRWTVERSRLDNVAIGAQQQFLQTGRADWQLLGQSVSALAMALDTNVQLRAQIPPNPDLIGESVTVVNRQRAELRQLIVAMQSTI